MIFNKKPPVAHSIGVELDSVTMSQFKPCHPVELYTMCFFDFLKSFALGEPDQTFIYADPPYLGFCAHFSDKSNVTDSALTRKGVTAKQLQQNNQLMPMDFRIRVDIATAI